MQHGFDMGSIPWKTMQILKSDHAHSGGAHELDARIQRNKSLGEITGIARDAMIADTQNRMLAIHTVQRRAAGARFPLIAGVPTGVPKILAARSLKHIAAERRHVADLWTRGKNKRLRNNRIISFYDRMVRCFGHPHQRAQAKTLRTNIDGPMQTLKVIDVDDD